MKKITVILSSGDHELDHNNGGLWVRGVCEAAMLCHPKYSYDDSYAIRLTGPGTDGKTWIVGWITEDGEHFDGAVVMLETCEVYPVGPQDGIMPMISNLSVRHVHKIKRAGLRHEKNEESK